MTTSAATSDIVDIPAGPVKRFFIQILTRDIELSAAILDLVDNSVDSARKLRPDGDFSKLRIDIEASGEAFTIADNCAGISIEAAKNYVFRLGRPEGEPGTEGSIGQFGVGMKRALFKLGQSFTVDSVTEDSHFLVELDVVAWEKDADNWFIPLRIYEPDSNGFGPIGTTIFIDKLNPLIATSLQGLVESDALKEELRSKHRMAIERGLTISLNGVPLVGTPTVLAVAENVAELYPMVQRFVAKDDEGLDVEVSIYAGVFATTSQKEDAEPEDTVEAEDDAGWYIFANDRLLIAADKTSLTGWGGGAPSMPIFHNQYARFRGYVYMRALNPAALPWNTTKTGVESSHPTWLKVRAQMVAAGKQITPFLNSLKLERTAERNDLVGEKPFTDILKTAKQLTAGQLDSVEPTPFVHAQANPDWSKKTKPNVKTITYAVPLEEYGKVSARLKLTTAADVGRYTFDYYKSRELQ